MLAALEEFAPDLKDYFRDVVGRSPPNNQWLEGCDCLVGDIVDLY